MFSVSHSRGCIRASRSSNFSIIRGTRNSLTLCRNRRRIIKVDVDVKVRVLAVIVEVQVGVAQLTAVALVEVLDEFVIVVIDAIGLILEVEVRLDEELLVMIIVAVVVAVI